MAFLAGGLLYQALALGPDDAPRLSPAVTAVASERGRPLLDGGPGVRPAAHAPSLIEDQSAKGPSVRVADRGSNLPIAAAQVTVLRSEPSIGALIDNNDVVGPGRLTDDQGECRLEAPAGGWILVHHRGYGPHLSELPGPAGTGKSGVYTVLLDRLLGEVGGQVVDTSGLAVASAKVAVCPSWHSGIVHVHASQHGLAAPVVGYGRTTTDGDGRFRVPVAVNGGKVRIDVLADGYVAANALARPGSPSLARWVASPGEVDLTLVVQPVRMFLVRLLDKGTGRPLRARAEVTPIDASGPLLGHGRLLEERVLFKGRWRAANAGGSSHWTRPGWKPSKIVGFLRLPPGRHGRLSTRLLVGAPGYTPISADVPLFATGDPAHWTELSMASEFGDEARTVHITVRRSYPPDVWEPPVRLLVPSGGFLMDALGSFGESTQWSFSNVPDRDVVVTVCDGVSSNELELRAGVNSGYEVKLDPSAAVTLALRDPDGVPLHGGMARCRRARGLRPEILPALTVPHESGQRIAQRFYQGRWTLEVVKWGYELLTQEVEIEPGHITNLEVTLRPTSTPGRRSRDR